MGKRSRTRIPSAAQLYGERAEFLRPNRASLPLGLRNKFVLRPTPGVAGEHEYALLAEIPSEGTGEATRVAPKRGAPPRGRVD